MRKLKLRLNNLSQATRQLSVLGTTWPKLDLILEHISIWLQNQSSSTLRHEGVLPEPTEPWSVSNIALRCCISYLLMYDNITTNLGAKTTHMYYLTVPVGQKSRYLLFGSSASLQLRSLLGLWARLKAWLGKESLPSSRGGWQDSGPSGYKLRASVSCRKEWI